MTSVGFDLHKRYITACARDADGTVLAECRQLASTIDAIRDSAATRASRTPST